MNILQIISKRTIVLSSSIVGLLAVAPPGEAVTFATSNSSFSFNNFSQIPESVSTTTDSDTISISSEDGTVITDADASALFNQDPTFSLNTAVSEAFGEGSNYLGIAESQASVLGQFEVLANTSFDFNFVGLLDLFTSIDDPSSEQVQATAGITFALMDEATTVLSSFELFGNLNTPGDGDELFVESTPNINWTIDDGIFFSGLNELEETASIVVSGSYSQSFTAPKLLTLVELKSGETFVSQEPVAPAQTPEPGSLFTLVSLGGIILGLKKQRQDAVK